MSTIPELIVNDIPLPVPDADGFRFTAQKIWSQNAGRNTATGDFSGDLIAKKYTVQLTYSTLTEAEFAVLSGFSESMTPFLRCRFPMHANAEKLYYMPEPTYTLRRRDARTGEYLYSGVQIEFIQK